jgi:hypothetical protein
MPVPTETLPVEEIVISAASLGMRMPGMTA